MSDDKRQTVAVDYDGLIERYFPERGAGKETYASTEAQWAEWKRFVDLLCVIALMRREQDPPEVGFRVGSLLKDKELMQALEPSEDRPFAAFSHLREVFGNLLARAGKAEEDAAEAASLWKFVNLGMLGPMELMALVISYCLDTSRKYERIFGILQEEEGICRPTVGLVHDLCSSFLTPAENDIELLLDEASFLNRILLEKDRISKVRSRVSTPVVLRQRTFEALDGVSDTGLKSLSLCCRILSGEDIPSYIMREDVLTDMVQTVAGTADAGDETLFYLEGTRGSGVSRLADCFGAAAGTKILELDLEQYLAIDTGAAAGFAEEVLWLAVMEQYIVFLTHFPGDGARAEAAAGLILFLQNTLRFLMVSGEGGDLAKRPHKGRIYTFRLPACTGTEQERLWKELAAEDSLNFAEDVDLDRIVSVYSLTPGQIAGVLARAAAVAEIDEEKGLVISGSLLEKEIKEAGSAEFGELATRINSPLTLEDIQLTSESEELVRQAINRIRHRTTVMDTYGFRRKLAYGSGTAIVFYGPPGTGKTMAAQVLANEVGLDIYRIDLSQISSKYIGETEKNLGAVFRAARGSNAILFFDEADSLFAKRTGVANSNDKHANAETAYLLQKIEEYSGVSILATNLVSSFDDAFKRRMAFMIPMNEPNEEERLSLWEKVFPRETPLGPDVNFEGYAEVAEMNGSQIKAAAVAAAYLAAAEGRPVSHRDLCETIDAEWRKLGRMSIRQQLLAKKKYSK